MGARPEYVPLDEVDREILQLLQRDARHATAVDIAERIDVSDGTVRNRIENLEQRGVIEGYVPIINYERAGYQLQLSISGTARIVDREQLAREALQIEGVVRSREFMSGRNNVEVVAVAPQSDDATRIAAELDEMAIDIESEDLIRHEYFRPFNHFGARDVSDGPEGVPVD